MTGRIRRFAGFLGSLLLAAVVWGGIALAFYFMLEVTSLFTSSDSGQSRREAWEECVRDDPQVRDPASCGPPP